MIPLHDFVIVEINKRKEKTQSGVLMPETAIEESSALKGKVVSVGDLVTKVKEGDTVYFRQYKFESLESGWQNKEIYTVIGREADILAKE